MSVLRIQSQAQRPPSPADLLSFNTASGGLIAPAVVSNSNKLKLLILCQHSHNAMKHRKMNNVMFPEIFGV